MKKENEDKKTDHNYDGIEELDNSLPKWWVNLFYLTILFSAGYFLYYSMLSGPTLVKEYQIQNEKLEIAKSTQDKNKVEVSESELRALLKKPDRVRQGSEIFQAKCIVCHGSQGQGGIGPNLTDNYWIHGGKMVEMLKTVRDGVPDKGMMPWGSILKEDELHSVVAYIKSIRGSNPPNPKPPQGELVHED